MHIAQLLLGSHGIPERHVVERQRARHRLQFNRARLVFDFKRQVDDFEHPLEAHNRGRKLHRRVRQPLQRAIQHAQVRHQGHDRADGKRAADDQVPAQPKYQGRAHRAQQADDDEEDGAHHRLPHAEVAHLQRPLLKAVHLHRPAPKQLHQQRAAHVKRLVHHGVHLSVGVHLLARDIAQPAAHPARRHQKQGQHHTR